MEKKRYERPAIIKHMGGLANKFGKSQGIRSKPEIDNIRVDDIVREFGSPVFIFSERTIRKNIRGAAMSFGARYPKVRFAWSYKTNYLDAVCGLFHDEGCWAEVVSEHEYDMALSNGVPGNRIIFNGPYKPEWSLVRAMKDGAQINIDHHDELMQIEAIARRNGGPAKAGLRINLDAGIHPCWDRFGFNLENGEAMDAARRIKTGGIVNLNGLHAHIGTFILDPSAYRAQAMKLASLAIAIEKELGFRIETIDIGGGFPSNSTLHEQYSPGEDSNPPIDAYAEVISSALLTAGFSPERLPTLVLETGRALIDSAGYLCASVVANKRLANGTRAVIIDAGVNTLFTSFWYRHNVYPVEEKNGMVEETVIYGPLCMNIDVIRPSLRLPSVYPGDLLVLHPVGAYNVTQWLQFIRMRPAVVMIGLDGQVAGIREPESVEYMKKMESVPSWIKRNGGAAK
ncbi:MAG: diaminopimelate decarboxylase [Spirochaetes bacterium]|nr:diaminopimelate decarboxylase [Spirochaetota bacterium]